MSDLFWFKVDAKETLSDGRYQAWTLEERGAFWTLLCHQWLDGSIPGDLPSLARLLHVDGNAMRGVWAAIGDRFIPHPDEPGRLANPRLEKYRDEVKASSDRRSAAGKKGATSRWDKEKERHSKRIRSPRATQASRTVSGCESHPDQETDQEEKLPPTRASAREEPSGPGEGPAADSRPAPETTPGPETSPPPARPKPRLVSPFPDGQDPTPTTTAVLAGLYERGVDAAPPGAGSAARVEAACSAPGVGVEVAIERLVPVLSDPAAPRPLTFHVDTIRGVKRPRRTHGDLGAELRPWPSLLTPEEREQARAEFAAIHPDLVDAPLGVPGCPDVHPVEEIREFNERWRARVEGRA